MSLLRPSDPRDSDPKGVPPPASDEESQVSFHGRDRALEATGDCLRSDASAPERCDPLEPVGANRSGGLEEIRGTKEDVVLDGRDVAGAARVVVIGESPQRGRDRLTPVGLFSWQAFPFLTDAVRG